MSSFNMPRELFDSPFETVDPGDGKTLEVDRWGQIIPLVVGAGTQTRTLPNPYCAGNVVVLTLKTAGGGTLTVTAAGAINQTGNTTMAFITARDTITLRSIPVGSGYRWQVEANDGVDLGP